MKKVLIVDDAKLMRNIIKDILSGDQRYIFFESENGKDAIECYKNHQPDLVTMDMTMEHENGLDVTRDILSYDQHAKIIIVTSLGQEKLIKDCIEAGVKDFVIKPFSKNRMLEAVTKALQLN